MDSYASPKNEICFLRVSSHFKRSLPPTNQQYHTKSVQVSLCRPQMYTGEDEVCRGQLKCDGTRAETRFRLSAKWTSPFKYAEVSVQSTIGSRGVRISGSNAGYTMFRGSVKGTGYPLHSTVSPSPTPPASPCAITFQLESTSALGREN